MACSSLLWSLRSCLLVKFTSQWEHEKDLWHEYVSCFFNWNTSRNDFPHCKHLKGFSSVWTLRCLFRWEIFLKDFSHWLQENGLSESFWGPWHKSRPSLLINFWSSLIFTNIVLSFSSNPSIYFGRLENTLRSTSGLHRKKTEIFLCL